MRISCAIIAATLDRPEVVIVGGGVIGAASAYFAGRAGFRTLLLEKRGALGTLTTAVSLACFRAQFTDAENIAMMRESIRFFEALQQEGDIGLVQRGYLFATTAENGYAVSRQRVEQQRACGLDDVELWDGDEARRHWPYLSPDVTAAAFRAADGWLSAHELTYLYARASGARVQLDTTVTGIEVHKGRVTGVATERGSIATAQVVIAAGPFSKTLAEGLGLRVPIELLRRQRAAIKSHPLIMRGAPMTIDADTGAHWRPDGQGALLAWALPEAPGEPLEEVPPDWEFAARVLDGAARVTPLWAQVAEGLHRSDLDVRAGQYDMTPDSRPLIGRHPEIEGLFFNCGYSGHGVMASPGGARVLAQLLSGERDEKSNPFRLDRFGGEQGKNREEMVL